MDIKNKLFTILLVFPAVSYAVNEQIIPSVVVKKNKFAESTSTKTGVTTVNEKQIKESGAKTLTDVLKTIPAISVSQQDGQGGTVMLGMRGFGDNASSNALILVDGQPLTNPDLDPPNLNIIPLSEVKEIKVMPLSEAVLYGDQAVGGVINIITKGDEKRHQVSAAYGSFNSAQGEMSLADKLGKHIGYHFFTQLLNTDNYRDHNNYHDDIVSGGLNYKQDSADAYINMLHTDTNLLFPGALSGPDMRHNPRQASPNESDFDDQKINDVTAGFGHDIGEDWQFKLNGRLGKMTGNGIMTDPFRKKRDAVQMHPAFLGVINAFKHSFLVNTGADFEQNRYVYNSQIYNTDIKQTIGAIYGQAKLPLSSKLSVTAGARAARAKTEQNNHVTIGSLMAEYQLNHNLQFYAQAAGNYRFPKTDEIAWTYPGRSLKTQTGISYVLGSTWQAEKLNLDINIYQLDLKNEILLAPINHQDSNIKNQNLPRTRHRGLNFNINYLILSKWRLSGGYVYADAKFTAGPNRGNEIPFVARHKFYLANYFYVNKNWYLMVDCTYTGGRYAASDIENKGNKIDAFAVLNSAIGYHFHKLDIILRINNITNKKYSEYAVYSYGYNGTGNYYYPAPGINGMLNLKIEL